MPVKYRTPAKVWGNSAPIVQVECLRETADTITTPEGRTRKVGETFVFHDTWEAAHAYLMKAVQERVDALRRSLQVAQGALGNIAGMRKP